MAGCSLSSNSPSLDIIEILRKLQSVGFCLDLSISSSDLDTQKLRSFLNRILSIFLEEIHHTQEIRPVPAMLGDGQAVDLFKLYWSVQENGGSDSVTANKRWAAVSEAIGFDPGLGSSLKLIYVKYLGALERWLAKVLATEERLDSAAVGELRAEVNGLFEEVLESNKKKEEEGWVTPGSTSKKSQFLTPVRDGARRLLDDDDEHGKDDDVVVLEPEVANGGAVSGSNKKQFLTPVRDGARRTELDDGDVVIVEPEAVNGGLSSSSFHKRKREALVGMLNWVLRVAENPGDPTIGKFLPVDGAKDKVHHVVGELYSQVLSARRAMFLKKIRRTDDDELLVQKGQMVHPSVYVDNIDAGTPASEKIRHSQRIHSVNKQSHSGSGSEASTIRDSDMDKGHIVAGEEANHGKRKLRHSSALSDVMGGLLLKEPKRIPVGSFFQAKVPPWVDKGSAISYNSVDLKWLGTPIWSPKKQERCIFKQDPIGKGRQDYCMCEIIGSVECVRFHVAEKRFLLKRELGSAFHGWRFDRMGEEVALSWTEEEARKFKAIVRLNPPSLDKNFWDQLRLCFPLKGRKNLVSYYFNVFLLARRSYQNRMTPNSIDSDDEDAEFGFLSTPFGHDAIKVHAPKSNFCAQNTQCVDLDD